MAAKTQIVDCYLHTLSENAIDAVVRSQISQISHNAAPLDHNNYQSSRVNADGAAPRRATPIKAIAKSTPN